MKVLTVQVPDDMADWVDQKAEEHDTSRSAVLRSALDNGIRARKYYPDLFPILPEKYQYDDAVEMAENGTLPR